MSQTINLLIDFFLYNLLLHNTKKKYLNMMFFSIFDFICIWYARQFAYLEGYLFSMCSMIQSLQILNVFLRVPDVDFSCFIRFPPGLTTSGRLSFVWLMLMECSCNSKQYICMNGCSKQLFNILPFPWIFFWCLLFNLAQNMTLQKCTLYSCVKIVQIIVWVLPE